MKTKKEISPEEAVEQMFAKFNDTQLSGLSLGAMKAVVAEARWKLNELNLAKILKEEGL